MKPISASILALLVLAGGCSSLIPTEQVDASASNLETSAAVELVNCQLPAVVRKKSQDLTHLTGGARVRVSAAECRERGGIVEPSQSK